MSEIKILNFESDEQISEWIDGDYVRPDEVNVFDLNVGDVLRTSSVSRMVTVTPLTNIDQLKELYKRKRLGYNEATYVANKKIEAEEWNRLWLAAVHQGNHQDDALYELFGEGGDLNTQAAEIDRLIQEDIKINEKLETIERGAQVNKIETIRVNGIPKEILSSKTVDLVIMDPDNFVDLTSSQIIDGSKEFVQNVIVPNATANSHAVNREDMFNYGYSKEEIGKLTQPISFETEQNFLDWLSGTFTRPDGLLPSDLLLGKKVIIQQEGKNNYQVAEVPVEDIGDFKILVEDNKYAEEIGFKPYETIEADNVQDAVEEVKDEVDLKTQIVRLDDLVINTEDWESDVGEVYFDHMIPEFTNTLEQQIEIQNNSNEQSTLFINEGITVKAVETIGLMPDLGIRFILNKAPSETITLSVWLSNSTNILFEPAEITAGKISYNNTVSGLIANNVQDAADELTQKSNNISDSLMDLEDRVDDLESEMIDKADTSYVDAGLAGKASTSALNLKADKTYVDTGLSTKANISDLNSKADTTYVDAGLGLKVNNSQIVQTTGNSTTTIMSQNAVTEAIPKLYKHSFSIKGTGINDYEIDKCFATLISRSNIAISSITQLKNKLSPGEILLCNGQLRKEEGGKNVFIALSHIRVQTNGDLMLHSSDIGFLVTNHLDVDNPNLSHRTSFAFSLNDTENNIDYWDVKEI